MLLSMPVNDEVLKEWGVDTLELHQQALANYNRLLPIKFANLNQHLLDRGFLKSEYYVAISNNDLNKDFLLAAIYDRNANWRGGCSAMVRY